MLSLNTRKVINEDLKEELTQPLMSRQQSYKVEKTKRRVEYHPYAIIFFWICKLILFILSYQAKLLLIFIFSSVGLSLIQTYILLYVIILSD
jgi:membrane protein insertase Oxa1/YidC/SpoIIIJ